MFSPHPNSHYCVAPPSPRGRAVCLSRSPLASSRRTRSWRRLAAAPSRRARCTCGPAIGSRAGPCTAAGSLSKAKTKTDVSPFRPKPWRTQSAVPTRVAVERAGLVGLCQEHLDGQADALQGPRRAPPRRQDVDANLAGLGLEAVPRSQVIPPAPPVALLARGRTLRLTLGWQTRVRKRTLGAAMG